ncbi:ubiquitin carboxyl-terminal hydrolase 20-like [Mytilus trossulus]|uniref:ubiquitin carboxyl-terminal hydrolase 20-like n=1 Tax=Mytilus trossulus TaxID=6551 RepID=UPI003005F467
MSSKMSRCPHVVSVDSVTWEELRTKSKTQQECFTCGVKVSNLWLCLVGACQHIGCGESSKDHSSAHAKDKKHSLTINLSSMRVWCYECETEVLHDKNIPSFIIPENSASMLKIKKMDDVRQELNSVNSSPQRSLSGGDETESEDEGDGRPRGLTGLKNLGNTCYLNAAVQALSNCPPLTRFFLDCQGFIKPEKSPMLSKQYLKLVTELWSKRRPSYTIPSGVVNGIKIVHPMFRGYSQQDAQEFLRCFMDQIHEELKQPLPLTELDIEEQHEQSDKEHQSDHEDKFQTRTSFLRHDRQISVDSSISSQSDEFYETCDSVTSGNTASSNENSASIETIDTSNNLSKIKASQKPKSGKNNEECAIDDSQKSNKEKKDFTNERIAMTKNEEVESSTDRCQEVRSPWIQHKSDPDLSKMNSVPRRGKRKNIQYQSVISDIFDGRILSSVQCLTCERISTTKETFQDLSLPIPSKDQIFVLHSNSQGSPIKGGTCGEANQSWMTWVMTWMKSWFVGPAITLQDCLAAFFSADELKGDNMYSCEKCKKLRNGIKFSRVMVLPEILTVHLKRFRHEFYSTKISTYVAFPLDSLDLKPFLHKDCTSEVTMYDLTGVICHHGSDGSGHYTAYCLNYVNEQWYEFDDTYVTEVDINQVMNCEAYVLFYRKRNDQMVSLRQKGMRLIEAQEPSLMQFFISKQWINRFNTFAEPGPISNHDFLCRHGGVPPHKVEYVQEQAIPFNQALWEFLYSKFGGGPVCNHLYACQSCQRELDQLKQRQQLEMETFIELNEKFKDEDNPNVLYAISMSWFKDWENFVRGKMDTPPGQIDNSRITNNKQGQMTLKVNSDHGQLSEEMWKFLFNIYGGGPELVIKQQTPSPVKTARSASPVRTSCSSPVTRSASMESKTSRSKDSGIESSSQRSESSVKEETSELTVQNES